MHGLCISVTTAPPTTPAFKQTFGALVPSQPRNVNANPISTTEIAVSWQEPIIANEKLQFYQLYYRSANVAESKFSLSFCVEI